MWLYLYADARQCSIPLSAASNDKNQNNVLRNKRSSEPDFVEDFSLGILIHHLGEDRCILYFDGRDYQVFPGYIFLPFTRFNPLTVSTNLGLINKYNLSPYVLPFW